MGLFELIIWLALLVFVFYIHANLITLVDNVTYVYDTLVNIETLLETELDPETEDKPETEENHDR